MAQSLRGTGGRGIVRPRMQAKASKTSSGTKMPAGSPIDTRTLGTRTPKTPQGYLNKRV